MDSKIKKTTEDIKQLRIPVKSVYWILGMIMVASGLLMQGTWIVAIISLLAIVPLVYFSSRVTQLLTVAIGLLLIVAPVVTGGNFVGLLIGVAATVLCGLTTAGMIRSKLPVLIVAGIGMIRAVLNVLVVAPALIAVIASGGSFWYYSWHVTAIIAPFFYYLGVLLLFCSLSRDPNRIYAAELPAAKAHSTVTLRVAKQAGTQKQGDMRGVSIQLLEEKNIALYIMLTIVTFGAFSLFWIFQIVRQVQSLTGKEVNPWNEFLLVVLVPFYILYWMHTRVKLLHEAAATYGVHISDNSTICVVLPLFNLAIVSWAIIQNDLNATARGLTEQTKRG